MFNFLNRRFEKSLFTSSVGNCRSLSTFGLSYCEEAQAVGAMKGKNRAHFTQLQNIMAVFHGNIINTMSSWHVSIHGAISIHSLWIYFSTCLTESEHSVNAGNKTSLWTCSAHSSTKGSELRRSDCKLTWIWTADSLAIQNSLLTYYYVFL